MELDLPKTEYWSDSEVLAVTVGLVGRDELAAVGFPSNRLGILSEAERFSPGREIPGDVGRLSLFGDGLRSSSFSSFDDGPRAGSSIRDACLSRERVRGRWEDDEDEEKA